MFYIIEPSNQYGGGGLPSIKLWPMEGRHDMQRWAMKNFCLAYARRAKIILKITSKKQKKDLKELYNLYGPMISVARLGVLSFTFEDKKR